MCTIQSVNICIHVTIFQSSSSQDVTQNLQNNFEAAPQRNSNYSQYLILTNFVLKRLLVLLDDNSLCTHRSRLFLLRETRQKRSTSFFYLSEKEITSKDLNETKQIGQENPMWD